MLANIDAAAQSETFAETLAPNYYFCYQMAMKVLNYKGFLTEIKTRVKVGKDEILNMRNMMDVFDSTEIRSAKRAINFYIDDSIDQEACGVHQSFLVMR